MADKKIKVKNLDKMAAFLSKEDEESDILRPIKTNNPTEVDEDFDIGQSDNKSGCGMGWYVLHTYSGYEKQVKRSIENAINNDRTDDNSKHLYEKILEVRIPVQDVVEVKTKGNKNAQKKVFPGYVIVHMDADDNHAWFVVRNTRGVTGFVGPGSKPVPLEPEEVARLQEEVQEEIQVADYEVGDTIQVVSGAWKDAKKDEPTIGEVIKVDMSKKTVTIMVEFMGQDTPVQISFADIKKLD